MNGQVEFMKGINLQKPLSLCLIILGLRVILSLLN
jgi:hypothetical protein